MLEWINQDVFHGFINSNENAIAYFSSPSCGACSMQDPILEQLSNIYRNVHIGKIDVTKNGRLAMEHGISGTPTLIFFKNGKKVRFKSRGTRVDRLLGAQDFNKLQGIINFVMNMKI